MYYNLCVTSGDTFISMFYSTFGIRDFFYVSFRCLKWPSIILLIIFQVSIYRTSNFAIVTGLTVPLFKRSNVLLTDLLELSIIMVSPNRCRGRSTQSGHQRLLLGPIKKICPFVTVFITTIHLKSLRKLCEGVLVLK